MVAKMEFNASQSPLKTIATILVFGNTKKANVTLARVVVSVF